VGWYYLFGILGVLMYVWLGWGMYVLIMGIYRAHLDGRLNLMTKCLGAPFILIGFAMDVLANIFVATILFAELPGEWLVTTRLTRYMHRAPGTWRGELARAICVDLLDLFDPSGTHCAHPQ
jgi:hypothetical protein